MRKLVFAVFAFMVFLTAQGCLSRTILMNKTDCVIFDENCVQVDITGEAPREIDDRFDANKTALDMANREAKAKLLVAIRKIAKAGRISVTDGAIENYIEKHVRKEELSNDNPKKGVWRIRRYLKLNGRFEGVNIFLGVPEIREKTELE